MTRATLATEPSRPAADTAPPLARLAQDEELKCPGRQSKAALPSLDSAPLREVLEGIDRRVRAQFRFELGEGGIGAVVARVPAKTVPPAQL